MFDGSNAVILSISDDSSNLPAHPASADEHAAQDCNASWT